LEEKNLSILRKELFNVLLEFKDIMTSKLPEQLVREGKYLYMEKANDQRVIEEHIANTTDS
jgi:hypothetical protein